MTILDIGSLPSHYNLRLLPATIFAQQTGSIHLGSCIRRHGSGTRSVTITTTVFFLRHPRPPLTKPIHCTFSNKLAKLLFVSCDSRKYNFLLLLIGRSTGLTCRALHTSVLSQLNALT